MYFIYKVIANEFMIFVAIICYGIFEKENMLSYNNLKIIQDIIF